MSSQQDCLIIFPGLLVGLSSTLSSPCSFVVDASVWATSPLGVAFRPVFCFFFFFFFPSRFCCPFRFQKSPQTHQWEGFLLFGNFSSFTTPFPWWVSIPNSLISLFVFYILSYLLLKRIGCLSGYLESSTSVQKLLCGSCSSFKWSFDEFVGEKVVSLLYSSAILGHPTELFNFYSADPFGNTKSS